MADAPRARKIADRIHETVARTLDTRVKDPRLGFVTVTEVRVTGDLQHATVFYTVYGDESSQADTATALESAKGLLRSEVGKATRLRLTPTLEFVRDALPESAAALEDALSRAAADDARVAAQAAGAQYAGEADPYRKPLDEDESDAGVRPDAFAAAEEPYEEVYEDDLAQDLAEEIQDAGDDIDGAPTATVR